MIRRLRRRHFVWSLALLVLGPGVLLEAVAVRSDPDRHRLAALPGGSPRLAGPAAVPAVFPLELVIEPDPSTGGLVVVSRPRGPVRIADPLLYFAPTRPNPVDTMLPPGSVLVGAAGAHRVTRNRVPPLPESPVWVVLWSNAHRRVEAVARARLPAGR